VCGLGLGVEVHEHRRLVTHDPCVVPRLQDDNRGRGVLKGAAVSVDSVYPAAGQEAHVGMAAEVRTHYGLHMSGPTEPGRVHEPPDADGACPDDVDLHASDLLMGGPWNGTKKRVHRHLHMRPVREGSTRNAGAVDIRGFVVIAKAHEESGCGFQAKGHTSEDAFAEWLKGKMA
jgi:hypothetical protein